jgi:hypothetical protein
MSVRIQVKDSGNKPVSGAQVIVIWTAGGTSSRWTDENGIADLECSAGTAERIQVNGREVGSGWLKDGINPVSER